MFKMFIRPQAKMFRGLMSKFQIDNFNITSKQKQDVLYIINLGFIALLHILFSGTYYQKLPMELSPIVVDPHLIHLTEGEIHITNYQPW